MRQEYLVCVYEKVSYFVPSHRAQRKKRYLHVYLFLLVPCDENRERGGGEVTPFFRLYFASLSQYVHSPIFFLPTHKKRHRFFFGICSVFFRYLSD